MLSGGESGQLRSLEIDLLPGLDHRNGLTLQDADVLQRIPVHHNNVSPFADFQAAPVVQSAALRGRCRTGHNRLLGSHPVGGQVNKLLRVPPVVVERTPCICSKCDPDTSFQGPAETVEVRIHGLPGLLDGVRRDPGVLTMLDDIDDGGKGRHEKSTVGEHQVDGLVVEQAAMVDRIDPCANGSYYSGGALGMRTRFLSHPVSRLDGSAHLFFRELLRAGRNARAGDVSCCHYLDYVSAGRKLLPCSSPGSVGTVANR